MTTLYVWIGRANRQRLQLLQDGGAVTADAVTRAVFRFGSHCLDTDDSDPIELTDSATVVEMQLGLTPGLEAGHFPGQLTIYDNAHPEGIAWQEARVAVGDWPVCD